jgi:hypothetical protein
LTPFIHEYTKFSRKRAIFVDFLSIKTPPFLKFPKTGAQKNTPLNAHAIPCACLKISGGATQFATQYSGIATQEVKGQFCYQNLSNLIDFSRTVF